MCSSVQCEVLWRATPTFHLVVEGKWRIRICLKAITGICVATPDFSGRRLDLTPDWQPGGVGSFASDFLSWRDIYCERDDRVGLTDTPENSSLFYYPFLQKKQKILILEFLGRMLPFTSSKEVSHWCFHSILPAPSDRPAAGRSLIPQFYSREFK